MIAASPLAGHVLPMALIGAHLRQVGHDVVMLTDDDHRGVVERSGLTFERLDPDAGVRSPTPASKIDRLLPELFRRYSLGRSDVRSTFIAPLAAQYRSLNAAVDSHAADAVLVDLAFTGALPLLATNPRPSVLVCGVGPMTLTSADTAPFGMAWPPRPGMDYTGMHTVVNRVLFRDIEKQFDSALRAVGGRCPVPLMDWPRLADRLVQLTVPGFEYPRRDLAPNVEFVGPVLPDSEAERFEEPSWWSEIIRARTVVHVTQGTHDNGDLDQLIGPTLAAFAGEADVVVVATTGQRTGQRLSFDVPANAHVVAWLPYSALLPHVDVMVTNGGYGGVHHALRYGVPVVVAGESGDKAEVAARVAHAGVGVNLKTAHPDAARISAAVRSIGDEHRAAARRLGHQISQTAPFDTIADTLAQELSKQQSAPGR
ncbi:glycosyltransferase [Mycobacterium sp. 2YAF39]|uniref:glycosyltransferase n=1 Tax=Mycobacterium sp. 2YAF39 TaxID=3233033 RepID=UPI003F95CF13